MCNVCCACLSSNWTTHETSNLLERLDRPGRDHFTSFFVLLPAHRYVGLVCDLSHLAVEYGIVCPPHFTCTFLVDWPVSQFVSYLVDGAAGIYVLS